MSLFKDYIHNQFKKSGLPERKFADSIGVKYTTFRAWFERDSEPKVDAVEKVLKKLGGDFAKALPGWTPDEDELKDYASEIKVIGTVTAGHAFISEQPIRSEKILNRTFSDSPYWHYGEYEPVFIEVKGNSMEPTYPERTLIACRRNVTDKKLIKNNTPCILLTADGETTFKLWQWHDDIKRGFGVPINDEHKIQYYKDQNVDVQLVVVGAVQYVGSRPPLSTLNHLLNQSPFVLNRDDSEN